VIYNALGWEVPVWAHLPMIHGPDGAKLSKRHGAQAVTEFDAMGYLPETLRNYLAKLGWGHGDDEIFSDAQAIAGSTSRTWSARPARVDWAKLNHLNNHYIRLADSPGLRCWCEPSWRAARRRCSQGDDQLIERTIPFVRDGAKTTLELADDVMFVLKRRPLELPEKAIAG
jgi:glutamyl-tRNA synthetase